MKTNPASRNVSFFSQTRDYTMLDHYQQVYNSNYYEAQGHLRSQS